MKGLFLTLAVMAFVSCTTIYKIETGKSEYILKKGNSFETFDYRGKDTFSQEFVNYVKAFGREELPVTNVTTSFKSFVQKGFIVYREFEESDTLFLEKNLNQDKTSILPGFHLPDLFVYSNELPLWSVHGRKFNVIFRTDSIHYFNNQPPVKTYVFDYYIINRSKSSEVNIDPITISVSSVDGMPLSIAFTNVYPNIEPFRSSYSVQDYRTVFAGKKRLKKFLM